MCFKRNGGRHISCWSEEYSFMYNIWSGPAQRVQCTMPPEKNPNKNVEKLCGERKPYWTGEEGMTFQQSLCPKAPHIQEAAMNWHKTGTWTPSHQFCAGLGPVWLLETFALLTPAQSSSFLQSFFHCVPPKPTLPSLFSRILMEITSFGVAWNSLFHKDQMPISEADLEQQSHGDQ